MKKILPFIAILLMASLLIPFLTSCVSYIGPKHVSVKGAGDNRYIDHCGVRYTIVPGESQKSGYWSPNNGEDSVILGRTKEPFYKWIVVSDVRFYDNGEGISYIHCGAYYYFPEGISGFPDICAANVDELIIGDAVITDRQIIDAFMALQDETKGLERYDRVSDEPWIVNGQDCDRIDIYNRDFDLIRTFLIKFDGDTCWIPVFKQPGAKYSRIPDDLYGQIMTAICYTLHR